MLRSIINTYECYYRYQRTGNHLKLFEININSYVHVYRVRTYLIIPSRQSNDHIFKWLSFHCHYLLLDKYHIVTLLYLLATVGKFSVKIPEGLSLVLIQGILHWSGLTQSQIKWLDTLVIFSFNIESWMDELQSTDWLWPQTISKGK